MLATAAVMFDEYAVANVDTFIANMSDRTAVGAGNLGWHCVTNERTDAI